MIRRPPRSTLFPTRRSSDLLKSDVADLKHTGERYGGSISAALFLQEFVGDTPWIHCDVAGPVLAEDRKSTRLNCSHSQISYAVFCLKKKKNHDQEELASRCC